MPGHPSDPGLEDSPGALFRSPSGLRAWEPRRGGAIKPRVQRSATRGVRPAAVEQDAYHALRDHPAVVVARPPGAAGARLVLLPGPDRLLALAAADVPGGALSGRLPAGRRPVRADLAAADRG